MSQISPPIRILLVLAVAVLGVYMLFLRPKPEEIPPLDTAGTTTTQPATVETEEPATAAAPATKADDRAAAPTAGAAAKPGEDLEGLPKPLRKAIRANKIVVVMFSNGKSADDKAVEKAISKVNRWDGRVFVHTAPLRKISRYGRIARGVSVEQSPTVVVADRELRAQTLVGYVDRTTIDQAVVDARRNTEGLYVDSYLKAVDKVCFAHSNRWDSVPFIWFPNGRAADRRLNELDAVWASYTADVKAVKAPEKWRAFHDATVSDMEAYGAVLHRTSVAITPRMSGTKADSLASKGEADVAATATRLERRFKSQNLPRCGSQF